MTLEGLNGSSLSKRGTPIVAFSIELFLSIYDRNKASNQGEIVALLENITAVFNLSQTQVIRKKQVKDKPQTNQVKPLLTASSGHFSALPLPADDLLPLRRTRIKIKRGTEETHIDPRIFLLKKITAENGIEVSGNQNIDIKRIDDDFVVIQTDRGELRFSLSEIFSSISFTGFSATTYILFNLFKDKHPIYNIQDKGRPCKLLLISKISDGVYLYRQIGGEEGVQEPVLKVFTQHEFDKLPKLSPKIGPNLY